MAVQVVDFVRGAGVDEAPEVLAVEALEARLDCPDFARMRWGWPVAGTTSKKGVEPWSPWPAPFSSSCGTC